MTLLDRNVASLEFSDLATFLCNSQIKEEELMLKHDINHWYEGL